MAFGAGHYVALLKGKRAEYGALAEVEEFRRPYITPLIDIPPATKDDVAAYAEKHARLIAASWPGPVFVDAAAVSPRASGLSPIAEVVRRAHARGATAIPVIGLGRAGDDQAGVRDAVERTGLLCLRLTGADFDAADRAARIDALLARVGAQPATTHLILDFGSVRTLNPGVLSLVMRTTIDGLPRLSEWATFTVAGSSMPEDLRMIARSPGEAAVERVEWAAWQTLLGGPPVARVPSFGDYAVEYPEHRPRVEQASAPVAIRYTRAGDHFFRRLGTFRRLGGEGFAELARWLVAWEDYAGQTYSWGDAEIARIAQGAVPGGRRAPTGNPETWRKIGTSHHLAVVADAVHGLTAATASGP